MSAEAAEQTTEPEVEEPDVDEPEVDEPEVGEEGRREVPSALDSLIGAFLDAGPEATEHLMRAAHELALAAQAVVDAAQRAVREQQDVRSARRAEAGEAAAPSDTTE